MENYNKQRQQKTLQELNLSDDFLFAKVMSDPEICKRVIEKILGIKIKDIKMPEEQKVIDILLDSKAVRLDIYVNDENGTVYKVEMQQGKNSNLAKRSRYYQGNIDLDKISKGQDYHSLNKSFVIFICTFDPFDRGRHYYSFENRCKEDLSLSLGDETTKIFLNTEGTIKDVDDEMLAFLNYVVSSTDEAAKNSKSELVQLINEKINNVKHSKKMEVEYMTLLERDRMNFSEGLEEGREVGRAEGQAAANMQMAKKLLAKGISMEEVASLTELSIQEIEALMKQ